MRTFTMILSAILITLISMRVSAKESAPAKTSNKMETCKLVTGYGTAIGRGPSHAKALEEARLICGSKMIDQYFAQRRSISDDAKDDLALACINLECQ